ncbi:MAG: hypothetical protein U0531_22495 [Dehalococcoidia bacterium]
MADVECNVDYGTITPTLTATHFDDVVQYAPPPTSVDDVVVGIHSVVLFDSECQANEGGWENITWGNLSTYMPEVDKNSLYSQIDWNYYGINVGPLQAKGESNTSNNELSPTNTEQTPDGEHWKIVSSHKIFEVLGKMAAFAHAGYIFVRNNDQVVSALNPRFHDAGIFPNMPHWSILNKVNGRSCDFGGPCIPSATYWETSYGLFHTQFPVPGVHWRARIWSVAKALGHHLEETPCGISEKIKIDGPSGGSSGSLPLAGVDKSLLCTKLTSSQ